MTTPADPLLPHIFVLQDRVERHGEASVYAVISGPAYDWRPRGVDHSCGAKVETRCLEYVPLALLESERSSRAALAEELEEERRAHERTAVKWTLIRADEIALRRERDALAAKLEAQQGELDALRTFVSMTVEMQDMIAEAGEPVEDSDGRRLETAGKEGA